MTTETLSETIQRVIYDEIVVELPMIHEEFIECIVHSIATKIQPALDEYDPVEEAQRAFNKASEKMGW